MKEIPQISESELEVMKVLWRRGDAASAEIIEAVLPGSGWKPKTIQTLITRLAAKGAIEADKSGGKVFRYHPLVDEKTYRTYANQNFLQKMYNGSLRMMLSSFVEQQELTPEELKELRDILGEGDS